MVITKITRTHVNVNRICNDLWLTTGGGHKPMIWNSLKKSKKLSCSERNTHLYILLKNGPISSPSAFSGFSAG